MATKPERRFKVVADNRRARFNYAIGDKEQQLPLAGVGEPLRKFSATCFGKS